MYFTGNSYFLSKPQRERQWKMVLIFWQCSQRSFVRFSRCSQNQFCYACWWNSLSTDFCGCIPKTDRTGSSRPKHKTVFCLHVSEFQLSQLSSVDEPKTFLPGRSRNPQPSNLIRGEPVTMTDPNKTCTKVYRGICNLWWFVEWVNNCKQVKFAMFDRFWRNSVVLAKQWVSERSVNGIKQKKIN